MLNKYLLNELMNFCPRQEPWDLALLTKTWYMNLTNIKLPFLEEVTFGSPLHLRKDKTIKSALLPSAESIRLEREYEMKHLNNLKRQRILAAEVQSSLREKQVGLRRPLPPK
uniref:Uncharacterized protein n=1 Tax=Suricata suricatta TaxID=37032 RepID=A0A673U5C0_SURSU